MAVFVPVGSMGEIIGQYFKQFGLTVAFAIAFSTLVAFSLTPMVSAYWLKEEKPGESHRNKYVQLALDKFEAGFQIFRGLYSGIMESALNNPKKVIAAGIVSLAMNIVLLPFVGTEYQPTYDSGEFTVNFKAPIGTSMEKR